MNARTLLGKEFLAAEDLPKGGVTLTISKAERQLVKSKESPSGQAMPVIFFKELDEKHAKNPLLPLRRYIPNATTVSAIVSLHGDRPAAWVGKKIELFPTTGTFFGKPNTPCIRVRAPSND